MSRRAATPRIVVAGSLAQKPHQGGHTWVFLQYLLGLKRLGWEVLFLDRLDAAMYHGEKGAPDPESSDEVRYYRRVMHDFELEDEHALLLEGGATIGLARREVLRRVAEAELVLNVMGFLDDEEILDAARRLVFLDIDPGFGQMWREMGWVDIFDGHDDFVTIGCNLGRADCAIPDCGIPWITTHQPIVLDRWPVVPPSRGPFTSVGAWRGRYDPIEFRGTTYGLRAHEFRKFAPLARQVDARFELALDIDEVESPDLELLAANRWQLRDPRAAAADPAAYRRYIARSGAEFMVAKEIYARSRSGWFSDRSICYLATGRPVVARDTGLEGLLPLGEGLLAFNTLDEAREAVKEVTTDRERHSAAARRLAEECFDSDRVLTSLDRLGVESP